MKAPTPGAEELSAALVALERIAQYVAEGHDAFEASVDRRYALVFLWANVGSQLKQYCRKSGVPAGTEPFAGPIRMRDKLVYAALAELRAATV